jgi:hypothetical protein
MPTPKPPEGSFNADAAKRGQTHFNVFATLEDVVEHYNGVLKLKLSDTQKKELVEYLKSI